MLLRDARGVVEVHAVGDRDDVVLPSFMKPSTVTSGPGTNASNSTWWLRAAARAASAAAARPVSSATIAIARWPCRSGALITHGYERRVSADHRAGSTPAPQPLTLGELVGADAPRRDRDRVREAEVVRRLCGDAHGPVGAGRDDPAAPELRATSRTPSRSSVETCTSPDPRVAVTDDRVHAHRAGGIDGVALCRPSAQHHQGGRAARAHAGWAVCSCASTACHHSGLSRYHAIVFSSPVENGILECQPSRSAASSVEPMCRSTWPGRSGT